MEHARRIEVGYDIHAAKKRLNITVNEDLVAIAQGLTDNLSATIEALLAEWARAERRRQLDDAAHRRRVAVSWNDFDDRHGHFGREWAAHLLPDDDRD